jgi:hypothetical protein
VFWANGGQSGSWQTDFGADFCGNIWVARQNLSQEPAFEGNVTQTNDAQPLHVHTIVQTAYSISLGSVLDIIVIIFCQLQP